MDSPCFKLWRCWLASIVVLSGFGGASWVAAQEDAVGDVKQALRRTGQPWYDADSDSLRALTAVSQEETRERGDWRHRQRTPRNWNWGGGGSWSWLGELMKFLGWCVLIALLGLLIYALVQTYLNLNPARGGETADGTADEALSEAQRIENLPVQLRTPKGDFLSVARYHYQTGNFGEAIVYLFSHRLLQLDRAGLIRLTKGKTNRQYLAEIRAYRDLQKMLGQTMSPFEDAFFGKHELSRERFEQCWKGNDQFQLMIEQVAG